MRMSWCFRWSFVACIRLSWPAVALAVLLLAACADAGPSPQAAPDPPAGQAITPDDLPSGVGRGFPVADVATTAEGEGLLQSGEPAPDFSMVLEDGRFVRLSELQGAPVVINFWATWCGPCRQEMPELVKAAHEEDVLVLAVNVQEARQPVEQFAAEFEMELPVVLDGEGKLRRLYRVPGLPTTYFVDRNGTIASLVVGPLTPPVLAERLAEIR